jgi:DNA-binding helix-turn-helix protein
MVGEIRNSTGRISRVAYLRKKSGLTREYISDNSGVSVNALNSIEKNKDNYSPNYSTVAKLAKFFKVSMQEVYDVDLNLVELEMGENYE